jgi:hypothetical protein
MRTPLLHNQFTHAITGRECAVGVDKNGNRYELVQYGENVHVGLLLSNGWVSFIENATIADMVERFHGEG